MCVSHSDVHQVKWKFHLATPRSCLSIHYCFLKYNLMAARWWSCNSTISSILSVSISFQDNTLCLLTQVTQCEFYATVALQWVVLFGEIMECSGGYSLAVGSVSLVGALRFYILIPLDGLWMSMCGWKMRSASFLLLLACHCFLLLWTPALRTI